MSATDSTASTTTSRAATTDTLPSSPLFTPRDQRSAALMVKGLFFIAGVVAYVWLSTLFSQMVHHQPLHLGGNDWVGVAFTGAFLSAGVGALTWYHEKTKKCRLPDNTKRVVGISLATFVFPPVFFASAFYSAKSTK